MVVVRSTGYLSLTFQNIHYIYIYITYTTFMHIYVYILMCVCISVLYIILSKYQRIWIFEALSNKFSVICLLSLLLLLCWPPFHLPHCCSFPFILFYTSYHLNYLSLISSPHLAHDLITLPWFLCILPAVYSLLKIGARYHWWVRGCRACVSGTGLIHSVESFVISYLIRLPWVVSLKIMNDTATFY